jgi:predicted house-cleaning noncanonical NTP pyrophosphatase (MazG superfamily)
MNENNLIDKEDEVMKIYNKLVRDKIPQIIEASGSKCEIRVADKDEHYELLEEKLKEEVGEFLEDKNIEELADVMEVLFGLAESLGYSQEDLVGKMEEKREERGGFKDGIVLESVYV